MNIIPLLMPDELLEAYRGRLAAFNALDRRSQVTELASRLRSDGSLADASKRSFIESVAIAHQRSVSDIVMEHTLWPLMAAIDRPVTPEKIESIARNLQKAGIFGSASRRELWLCHKCVEEDLYRRRFAYWHRSHQVPGRHSCPSHGTPLRFITMPLLLVEPPDEALHRSESIDEAVSKGIPQNAHVGRAIDFLERVLADGIVLDRLNCMAVLKARAYQQGDDLLLKVHYARFVSRLESSFSLNWLRWAMPDLRFGPGLRHRYLDACTIHAEKVASIIGTAVVSSALFASADEAIKALVT
jgi:hypothetical protein